MSLLFADTHNVVAILEKSAAAEGFEQIINFLSGSYIYYALTVDAAVVEDVTEDVAHMATPSPPPHGISSPPQEPSSPPHRNIRNI
nr:hypothetical protein [Tanacetum cinerariifolium]